MKTVLLDTNVLLHNPESLNSFPDTFIILPMTVIEELDTFKKNTGEIGRNARATIRELDRLRSKGSLCNGVDLDNGGIVTVQVENIKRDKENSFDMSIADNRIISVAYDLMQKVSKLDITFITNDINARVKADVLGIKAISFDKQTSSSDTKYKGWKEIAVSSDLIDMFYKEGCIPLGDVDAMCNEFLVMKSVSDVTHSAIGRVVNGSIVQPGKNRRQAWTIGHKSKEQHMALDLLLDPSIHLVTLSGHGGTGKTLLALAAALETTINRDQYDKILVSRPIVPLGNDIGYLPGSKESKLALWNQPINDNLEFLMQNKTLIKGTTVQKEVNRLISDGIVEVEALTYIRGRSISRQFLLVDEAQQLDKHEIRTIVSRAGNGTKVVLTGDKSQIDTPRLDAESNGLSYVIDQLKGNSLFGHVTLKKGERSPLAEIAANLL